MEMERVAAMSTNRVFILLGLFVSIPTTTLAQLRVNSPVAAPDRTAASGSSSSASKPSASKSAATAPEFPLVVRIDNSALDPLREKDINRQGTVDRIVLGTRAIGTSWTTGAIDVEMIPDRDDASFTIRFLGKTQTKTTGSNGPALIYSRTFTDFECARRVVFDPRIGMVAGPCVSRARTTLVYDGFGSSGGALGRRLVARVAERRAGESFEQARAIAQRDNEAEVHQAFEKRLDEQLAGINRRLDVARYVNALFGPMSKPRLATRSSQNSILIGIGNEQSPERLVTYPPEREKPAPIEVWVHNSMLGQRLSGLAAIVEKIDDRVLPSAAQMQVLQVMFGAPPEDPTQKVENQFDVGFKQGWFVIGMKNDSVTPAPVAAAVTSSSAPPSGERRASPGRPSPEAR